MIHRRDNRFSGKSGKKKMRRAKVVSKMPFLTGRIGF
jgi:hypothetical protein